MERAQSDDQCQHPGCKCPRPATGDYCSDYCANAQAGWTTSAAAGTRRAAEICAAADFYWERR